MMDDNQYPEERYDVCTIERKGKSAKDTICAFANNTERGFDFLVTGCVGRKGPKLYVAVGRTKGHNNNTHTCTLTLLIW